jgi:hypothetical protein
VGAHFLLVHLFVILEAVVLAVLVPLLPTFRLFCGRRGILLKRSLTDSLSPPDSLPHSLFLSRTLWGLTVECTDSTTCMPMDES